MSQPTETPDADIGAVVGTFRDIISDLAEQLAVARGQLAVARARIDRLEETIRGQESGSSQEAPPDA